MPPLAGPQNPLASPQTPLARPSDPSGWPLYPYGKPSDSTNWPLDPSSWSSDPLDGWRMDGRAEFLPILQDFVPCWGRCPATLGDFTSSKKQGKGTADMMPFGDWITPKLSYLHFNQFGFFGRFDGVDKLRVELEGK